MTETAEPPLRWSRRMAFSAVVHFLHSAGILVLTFVVPAPADVVLRTLWGVAALFSVITLLLLLRVGSYEGTTEEEVSRLIPQGYWVATGLYLCLLAASLYFIYRPGS